MSDTQTYIPRRITSSDGTKSTAIAGPTHDIFTQNFGTAFPKPHYLTSDFGKTAVYDLPPPSTAATTRHVLLIHGAQTPGLGMLLLARALQKLDPGTHIVLYDFWGHGLSSTPLAPHTPGLFHFQVLQVLAFKGWSKAHIAGYSYGGRILASFAAENPTVPLSLALLAPAGLMDEDLLDKKLLGALGNTSEAEEDKAAKYVLDWLEGGEIQIPKDSRERIQGGEAVAEELRKFGLDEHKGYRASILSMFREGKIHGSEEVFSKAGALPVKKIGILGELDGVCNRESQLTEVGFADVRILKGEQHAFVRSNAGAVADILNEFWTK